jgi:hypothetical protein
VNGQDNSLPIEFFIQALTAQLDRAQSGMALKARLGGLPLTFAVRDISLDLRTHVEIVKSAVHIRPAGPGDKDASTLHLTLATITRPMIEENTREFAASTEPTVKEVVGDQMDEEEQRRLEWAGIHTVSQLREVQKEGGESAIERVANIPAMRLRAALERASQPIVKSVDVDASSAAGSTPLLRISGYNLTRGVTPNVRIAGEQVPVIKATEREIFVRPGAHQLSGTLEVETLPGSVVSTDLQINGNAYPKPTSEKKAA